MWLIFCISLYIYYNIAGECFLLALLNWMPFKLNEEDIIPADIMRHL